MSTSEIEQLAEQLRSRNEIEEAVAKLVNRPMTVGHVGEWIASQILDIHLEDSAAAPAIDGHFRSGVLAGRSVNIKWYLKREGLLDMSLSREPDYYLVLAGPPTPAVSSKGSTRPWRIDAVYLFDAHRLRTELEEQRL